MAVTDFTKRKSGSVGLVETNDLVKIVLETQRLR